MGVTVQLVDQPCALDFERAEEWETDDEYGLVVLNSDGDVIAQFPPGCWVAAWRDDDIKATAPAFDQDQGD